MTTVIFWLQFCRGWLVCFKFPTLLTKRDFTYKTRAVQNAQFKNNQTNARNILDGHNLFFSYLRQSIWAALEKVHLYIKKSCQHEVLIEELILNSPYKSSISSYWYCNINPLSHLAIFHLTHSVLHVLYITRENSLCCGQNITETQYRRRLNFEARPSRLDLSKKLEFDRGEMM